MNFFLAFLVLHINVKLSVQAYTFLKNIVKKILLKKYCFIMKKFIIILNIFQGDEII
ncbi:hypothetical protein HMPREF0518_1388 [Lactobacillus helveticus DSM 20075 = CGMCC 1.1877]|nr:hypothetical protein HMPREF0518_1388 [Lactobacillus helveticus DSM 20075 = CGMCC 1.1877]